ncbi:MAG TPA: 6-phosphogluconolactonase [Acidimicrobiales bacterium]|nr:6-phosphogluconolactonase [Acidimicrobiales bacterium]
MARPVTTDNVLIVDDVAPVFADTVIESFANRVEPGFTLVLSGGPTARLCYERLADVGAAAVDWSLVDVLMGDERCVAPEDPDANQRLVREALLDRVAPVAAFHPMSCAEVDDYDRLVAWIPALDLVHLGLGPDGHTASLFPGSPDLDPPPGRMAVVTRDPNGLNPHDRMTLTYTAIARARRVVFTVSGESKREAFAKIRSGIDLPATRVRAAEILWIVDRDAAGGSKPHH